MKRAQAILSAALVIGTAGCVLRGKPKAAPTPPPPAPAAAAAEAPAPAAGPLSIPQTQVTLPPEQPLNLDALPVETQAAPPESPPRPRHASRPRPTAPKPETAAPTVGPPATPPPESRPPIQEVVPAEEQKHFQEQAQARKREVRQWLDTAGRRRLNRRQQNTVERIQAFLKDSDDAEGRGDMREADALAERAQILLRELQNGQ